jgi:hypothetical protein
VETKEQDQQVQPTKDTVAVDNTGRLRGQAVQEEL